MAHNITQFDCYSKTYLDNLVDPCVSMYGQLDYSLSSLRLTNTCLTVPSNLISNLGLKKLYYYIIIIVIF